MELLLDPLKDRVVKNFKAPPHRPLDKSFIWPEKLKGIFDNIRKYTCFFEFFNRKT